MAFLDNNGVTTLATRLRTYFALKTDVPTVYTGNPAMDGTASAGSGTTYARGNHVHPHDTSRVPTSTTINGKALSSNVTLSASDVGAVGLSNGYADDSQLLSAETLAKWQAILS